MVRRHVAGLSGAFFIGALLLAVGGVAKMARPLPAALAMRSLGMPAGKAWSYVLGAGEAGVAGYALAVGNRIGAVLVAIAYAGFTVFVAVALLRGSSFTSCGCFGAAETPPSSVHLVLDSAAAIVAAVYAVDPAGGLVAISSDQPGFGIPYLAFLALGTYLAYVSLTWLPQAMGAAAASARLRPIPASGSGTLRPQPDQARG